MTPFLIAGFLMALAYAGWAIYRIFVVKKFTLTDLFRSIAVLVVVAIIMVTIMYFSLGNGF